MALTHEVLQFKLEDNKLANDSLYEIEKLFMRYGLQDRITETFRASTKPLLMLVAEGGR